ncbi:MAG: hypothetical protein AAF433_20215 [Bacteroidota bacterium]
MSKKSAFLALCYLFGFHAEGLLVGQYIPIWPSNFYKVLDAPYSDIIKATQEWENSTSEEKSLDSIKAHFDQQLEKPALEDRERVCLLAAYGQLLIRSDNLSSAYTYCKDANDLAVKTLVSNDLIRGYAQAGYGFYLDFYHAPELAIVPLRQSLEGLSQLVPEGEHVSRSAFWLLIENQIQLGLLENAQQDFELRTAKLNQTGDLRGLAWAYNNYGLYLQKAGRHEEAIMVLDTGLNVLTDLSNPKYLNIQVNTLETRTHSLVATNNFELAIEDLQRVYTTRKRMDRYEGAMQALNYLIGYLSENGKYEEAYEIYLEERAYVRSRREVGRRSYQLYRQLGALLEELGFQENAIAYYAIYNNYAAENILPLAKASAQTPQELSEQIYLRVKTFEQNALIARLETEQLRKELRLRQYGLILIALLTLLLLIFGLGWRWKRRQEEQERRRAEADHRRILELENTNLKYSVASQGKDIKRLVADNRLRTKLKRDLLQRIEDIHGLPSKDRDVQLGKLKRELSSTIEDQEIMSKLQDQIETINAAFEQCLTERIPGITAQEIRYCGLLRLSMDDKQIAKLLHKSYGTVRIYKHRISKKAGINGKDALKKLVDSL